MKVFLKYYKWELHNELYASIYFAAMLFMYSILVFVQGERSVDIFVMLEMLLVCYVMAIMQKVILSEDTSYSKNTLIARTSIWFVFSLVFVITMSLVFQWFADMGTWALGAFIAYMVIGFIAIWIGIFIANKVDTKNLNNMLNQYQEKRK